MDGKARQSQPRGRGWGRGRDRQFNHHLSTLPTTPPPVNVVREDEHSGFIKKNDPTGMLNLHVANKLNICDDGDVSVSETRTGKPTHQTETEPFDIKKGALTKCVIPSGTGACSGNVKDSKAWQSQPGDRGWGRGRPCNHHPSTSPATPPPVNDVGDEHSVSVNVNGNVNVGKSGSIIKNGSKTWPQKSDENEKKNDTTGMLHLHVANKLNISDDDDVSVSETRTSKPTHQTETEPFDICPPKQCLGVKLKPTLLAMNRERRKEMKQSSGSISGDVLRPGMVLLKSYISLSDQVKIVKKCRELGMGRGGFYQPGYEDGTTLHLKMMCLGKNWDPQTSQYGDQRPYDGAHPPCIPPEFHELIHAAIRDSRSIVQQHSKTHNSNPHNLLPDISSDICIVNFYSQNGRLGLHKDKDESEKSIRAGLPVVSFSIGDSADFLYGDERDVDMAEKVLLESGDVLIFGGKSRSIFHGVTTIRQNSAPDLLLRETNLRPGRLNLTFRQYAKGLAVRSSLMERSYRRVEIGWQVNGDGRVTINTDGARRTSIGVSGCGGVMRDGQGRWIGGFAKRLYVSSAYLAELWGALEGLNLAASKRLSHVELQLDSLALVQCLTNNGEGSISDHQLVRRIKQVMATFTIVRVIHIYREANKVADALANMGCDFDDGLAYFDVPPPSVKLLVDADVFGVLTPRLIPSDTGTCSGNHGSQTRDPTRRIVRVCEFARPFRVRANANSRIADRRWTRVESRAESWNRGVFTCLPVLRKAAIAE